MKKQPTVLGFFFATEMWERYGFYAVQSLLALYLSHVFDWPDDQIYQLVGSFTALTYLSPVIGGYIADNFIGQKKSIILGDILLMISYMLLAYSGSENMLPKALALIAVGTGLLKPNISSLLGNLYDGDSLHRERGFTIFYMGIASGIILGTTIPSYISIHFGWSQAFMSAVLGILFSLFVILSGIYFFHIEDYKKHHITLRPALFAIGIITATWVFCYSIMFYPTIADLAFFIIAIASAIYVIKTALSEDKTQSFNTLIIGVLCLISVLFWAFYFQMFTSLTLFIERVAKPNLFSIDFPPPYYVAVQSIGIVVLGGIIAKTRSQPNGNTAIAIGRKFVLAMLIISGACALITFACWSSQPDKLLSPLWILPAYVLIALAELYLSPIGLSAITILAAKERVSTLMGIFFVSLGLGGFLSGKLAMLASQPSDELSVAVLKVAYQQSFVQLSALSIAATGLSTLLYYVVCYYAKQAERA